MTYRELALVVCLSESAAEWRVVEQRIVAEPMRASGLVDDAAFHRSMIDAADLNAMNQRDGANKPRRAIRNAAQFLEEQPVVGFVRCSRSGKSRRVDTRRGAERIHRQPGIVGEEESVHVRAVVAGFGNS